MACSKNIVVNRSRNAHDRKVEFVVEDFSTGKTTVATNNDKRINTCFYKIIIGFFTAFGVMNSLERADFKMVPPLLTMLFTLLVPFP